MPLPPPPKDLPKKKVKKTDKPLTALLDEIAGLTPAKADVVVDGFCAEWGEKKRQARLDANWQTIADVDWEDLEHFVELARVTKASAHFDTCVRIIEALRKQVKAK